MDFIGEIIEREVEAPSVPVQREVTGFPKRDKEKKESRWKQRQLQQRKPASLQTPKPKPEPKPMVHLSEAEKIHNENMEKISRMTEGEIEAEREELLEGLNPNLVKALLARVEKRQQKESESHSHGNDLCHDHHAEGSNTDGWIGGDRNGKLSLPSLDKKDVDLALGIGELDIDKEEDLSGSTEAAEGKFKDEDGKKKVRFDQVTSVKYEDLDDDVELDPNGWEDVDDINDLVPNTHLIQHDDEEEVAADGYQLVDENEHTHSHGPGVHFLNPNLKITKTLI